MKTKVDILQMIDRLLDMEKRNSTTGVPSCHWKKDNSASSSSSSVVALPDNWLPMTDQKFLAVNLGASTSEFLSVKHHFHQTVSKTEAEIMNIRRIQNPDLWKSYVTKKNKVFVEKDLFFPVSQNMVEAVCEKNFDRSLSSQPNDRYGSGCYFMRDASACKGASATFSDGFSTQQLQRGVDLNSFPQRSSECKSVGATQRFSYPRCTSSEAPVKTMSWPKWFWNDLSQSGPNCRETLANQTDKLLGKDLNGNDVQHGTILFLGDKSPKSEIIAPADHNLTGNPMKPNQRGGQNSLRMFNDVFLTLPLELSPVISILRALEVRFHDLLLEFDDPILHVNSASLRLDEVLTSVIDALFAISDVENHLMKACSRLQQGVFHLSQSLIELNNSLQEFKIQLFQLLKGNRCPLHGLTQTVDVLIRAVEQFNETVPMIHGAMHKLAQLVIHFPTLSASMSAAVTDLDHAMRPYGRFVILLGEAYQDIGETIPAIRNVSDFRKALLRLHEKILMLSDGLVVSDQVFGPIQQMMVDAMHCHSELSLAKRQLGEVLVPHLKYVINCLESALQPVSQGIQRLVHFLTLSDARTNICPSTPLLIETPHQGFIVFDYVTLVPPVINLNLTGPCVRQNDQPLAQLISNSGFVDFGQTFRQFSQLKQDLCRAALHMNKPVMVIDRIINQFRNELRRLGNNLPELDKAVTSLEKAVGDFASFKQIADKAFPKLRVAVPKLESAMSEFAANLAPFNHRLVQLNEDRKCIGISSEFERSPTSFQAYQPIGSERKIQHDMTSSDTSSIGSSVESSSGSSIGSSSGSSVGSSVGSTVGLDSSSLTRVPRERRFVFLAKVLVGRYAQGRPEYTQPPVIDCGFPLGKHYDSCVDDADNPATFVTFDFDQFYPLYLIEYAMN